MGLVRALRERRPVAVLGAGALIVAVVGGGAALAVAISNGQANPSPSPIAFESLEPTDSPTPGPTVWTRPDPTVTAAPEMVAATSDGVYLTLDQASLATRHPIAVMIDDHWGARPQSGLSQADVVYHAPAEGGIPRYMAIFQTQTPESIGPIRSSRYYYVEWAEEWDAMYVHCGGAPNALSYLAGINKTYVWNADEFKWGGKAAYMWRVDTRIKPHNVYTSGAKLEALAKKLGATAPFTKSPWTFADALPIESRPEGGWIKVTYDHNAIGYAYDRATNTYLRSVQVEGNQYDAGNGQRIAPSNVIILNQKMYALAGEHNLAKHRLDVKTVGTGSAIVFNNGQVIPAVWSKKKHDAPTIITYATGPLKGKPVPMVRGQIFVQVVYPGLPVTYTIGKSIAPVIQ